MRRLSDGSIAITPQEVGTVRAALFGALHLTQDNLGSNEFRYVTGHTREEVAELLVSLDELRRPEAADDVRKALNAHLEQLGRLTDAELLVGRTHRRLRGVVREAADAGIDVPGRLRTIAGGEDATAKRS